MSDSIIETSDERLRRLVREVVDLLEKQKLEETILQHQPMSRHELIENLMHKQHQVALRQKLDSLHAADIAYVLESLPQAQRLAVWAQVDPEMDGEILLHVSDAVRESLISDMDRDELLHATEQLDTDEIADLAPDLPEEVMQELLKSLNDQTRAQLESVLSYEEDTVAAIMDFGMVAIREDTTLGVVLRYLRQRGDLPENTDKLFVVDKQGVLRGVLSLKRLLLRSPEARVADVMSRDVVMFHLDDDASVAARAFERYGLLSVPVVDDQQRLVGRVSIDAIVDYIRHESDEEALAQAGLLQEEDLFAGIWKSVKNRWVWLGINLLTAFASTRVIDLFDDTISRVVALASLMPIVAGIGGNTGTQTSTLIVRSLALGLVDSSNVRRLVFKEIAIGLINGIVWGSVIGVLTYALYRDPKLASVMAAAMTLNLLVAAVTGLFVPLIRARLDLDPAIGTSVLLTAITDGMGFFIFLGLATLFLLN
ncbi:MULTISPECIES: magnesium transporter [Methylococcus]|jgi:magnesium transporter|uniref:Magnesium transporter MgtE n=2 Tax=Methylococcus capsulatus TaxID=414 RepID=Q60CJ8_METCA|nr:magnesium transporter [Methylococcus capsulatus]AAU90702.1 magnesium transporter [Methylococcus capsulatus str. Bath]QXP86393.1 magnesium transporter [Methylococcus capsulatus]QXP89390.1 magnesium transporter [Methylococcus capsulatus]QXP93938.1 magnesium transporter [Methylococcus capsulatus]UQN11337.1 magnesium transporter [Methylococcus capsulatus]